MITVNYSSITVGGNEISMYGRGNLSFTSPYNTIVANFSSTSSINTIGIYIRSDGTAPDPNTDTPTVYKTNIAANTSDSIILTANSTTFPNYETVTDYVIYICAKGADGQWDITGLFLVLTGTGETQRFITSDGATFNVPN